MKYLYNANQHGRAQMYTEINNMIVSCKDTNAEALAMIMTKDYAGAKRVLGAIRNADANTAYLLAIVAARTNDAAAVAQNLQKAVSLDPSLKNKIKNDIEFIKYQSALTGF